MHSVCAFFTAFLAGRAYCTTFETKLVTKWLKKQDVTVHLRQGCPNLFYKGPGGHTFHFNQMGAHWTQLICLGESSLNLNTW